MLASEVQVCCFLFYYKGFLLLLVSYPASLSQSLDYGFFFLFLFAHLGLLCFLLDCSSFWPLSDLCLSFVPHFAFLINILTWPTLPVVSAFGSKTTICFWHKQWCIMRQCASWTDHSFLLFICFIAFLPSLRSSNCQENMSLDSCHKWNLLESANQIFLSAPKQHPHLSQTETSTHKRTLHGWSNNQWQMFFLFILFYYSRHVVLLNILYSLS